MRISDWSSDVCSSDLLSAHGIARCLELSAFRIPTSLGFLADEIRQASLQRRDVFLGKPFRHELICADLTIELDLGADLTRLFLQRFIAQRALIHRIEILFLAFRHLKSPQRSAYLEIGRAHVCTPVPNAHLV